MAYIYNIMVPFTFRLVSLHDGRVLMSQDVHFVVDFRSKSPIGQPDVTQAELCLQGFRISTDTELIRCVKHIADNCMTEAKRLIGQLYLLRSDFPIVRAESVPNGRISWNERRIAEGSA